MVELRLMENWLWNDTITITSSSEDPSFPTTNLKEFLRANVWKSDPDGGTFIITAGSNDSLDITDSSSTVVATLTAGTFTASELATEIKTQLDAASVDVFTVTYSSITGKWTIVSDGSVLSLLASTGGNVGTSTWADIGFAASDLTGALTYTGAAIAIHMEESLVIDFKTTEIVDSFALLFNSLDGIELTSSAVVSLQANATNFWTSPSVDQVLTLDEISSIALHFFTSDQTFRFWRLKIVDPDNPNLQVSIAKMVIADATTIKAPKIGFPYNLNDLSREISTPFGHKYYDVIDIIRRGFEFQFALLTEEQLETFMQFYERNGITNPIFLDLDPIEEILDKERYSLYGNFKGGITATHVVRDVFNSGLSIEEQM